MKSKIVIIFKKGKRKTSRITHRYVYFQTSIKYSWLQNDDGDDDDDDDDVYLKKLSLAMK